MVLNSSLCHLGKMRSVGSGVRHSSPSDIRIFGHFGGGTHALNAPRTEPASKSLKWTHCTGHTLAISESAFSAHFNLKDRLAQTLVVNDLDIAELKAPCLIRPQPGIAREEDIIMQLLRLPFEAPSLRLKGAFSSRFTEFLVFFW
jgi:hypothetical protein